MRRNNQYSGFTLVELILYVGISTTVLVAGSLFLAAILSARVKNQTVSEVEHQGMAIIHQVTESIRNAEAILAPSAGTSSSTLNLDSANAANDPTIFSQSGNAFQIMEGVTAAIPLTNSRVIISDLSFQNVSRSGTPGSVKVQFTLSYANPSNRQEYSYSKTFYGTSTLRQP